MLLVRFWGVWGLTVLVIDIFGNWGRDVGTFGKSGGERGVLGGVGGCDGGEGSGRGCIDRFSKIFPVTKKIYILGIETQYVYIIKKLSVRT